MIHRTLKMSCELHNYDIFKFFKIKNEYRWKKHRGDPETSSV